MKIILVNPYFKSHIIIPPLGLAYLASYLRHKDSEIDISLIDCLRDGISNSRLTEIISRENPDLLGFTVYSLFYENVKDVIRKIREKNGAVRIIIGGPHVSALPVFSLEDAGADFSAFGEGEETLAELADTLMAGENVFSAIKGLCYHDSDGRIMQNPPRAEPADINSIPWPDWQLIRPDKYPPAPHGAIFKRFPIAPVITTRGCPFTCTFCATRLTWGNRIRYRSENDVVNEIEYLVKTHGVREIHFEDDNLTLSREHVTAICKEIIRRELDIVWACPNGVRIDTLDEELLNLMKNSGCYLLAFGIESGSQDTLDKMNKNLDKNKVYEVLRKTKEAGIETWGFFILGFPDESREDIMQTIAFAKKLPLDRAQFCNFAPLPGTALFNSWLKQRGIKELSQVRWDSFSFYGRNIFSNKLSPESLGGLQNRAFISFYFRPMIALKILFKIRIRQWRFIVRRLAAYIFR